MPWHLHGRELTVELEPAGANWSQPEPEHEEMSERGFPGRNGKFARLRQPGYSFAHAVPLFNRPDEGDLSGRWLPSRFDNQKSATRGLILVRSTEIREAIHLLRNCLGFKTQITYTLQSLKQISFSGNVGSWSNSLGKVETVDDKNVIYILRQGGCTLRPLG